MTVTVYKSSDASAPALTGTAGALSAIIYACLVTGYGSQSAAGWAREFTGTNKGVFRAAAGNRMRLRVDDTGSIEARIVGYESMSDVDTGTGPFPTAAQISGGLFVRKSNTADATNRPWLIIANDRIFYMLIDSGTSGTDWSVAPVAAGLSGCFGFGEFLSYKSTTDLYNTIIFGAVVTSTSVSRFAEHAPQNTFSAVTGHYMPRNAAAVSGAITCSKSMALGQSIGAGAMGASANWGPYPDPVTGGLLISPMLVCEAATSGWSVRGLLPGLWAPMHTNPGAHADTFSGSGVTAGKTFLLANVASTSTLGRCALETSNTW